MKVFTRDYRITGEFPSPFNEYVAGMSYSVLDIETSGLSSANSKCILVGLLTRTDSGVRVTQFLAENHYEENRVLEATMDFLDREGIDYLITYNGKSFDVPFINARLESTFMGGHISLYDFDLYRFLKLGTDLKKRIGSLRQMSVEDYYGIFQDRMDTITGRESVSMFDEYSLTGNATLEKVILTHNREDVLQLHRLMYLALDDIEDMHTAMALHGFPVMNGKYSVRPSLAKSGKVLKINGDQNDEPVSLAYFPDMDSPLTAVFKEQSSSFEIEVPIENAVGLAGAGESSLYMDARSLGLDIEEDPDCVNGYLILNPRTVNLAASLIVEQILQR